MNQLQGSFISTGNMHLCYTSCHDYPLTSLFTMCRAAIESNNRVFMYGDRLIRTNLHWIRDYILTMKGFRFFEKDLTSFPDLLLENQTQQGFFFEIIAPLTDPHSGDMSGYRIPKLPVPETLDDASRNAALAQKDPIQVLGYQRPNQGDTPVERCLQACPYVGSSK